MIVFFNPFFIIMIFLKNEEKRRKYELYPRAAADAAFVNDMVHEASAWSASVGDGLAEADA